MSNLRWWRGIGTTQVTVGRNDRSTAEGLLVVPAEQISRSGHVFVVRGSIDSIDADVVVVPTDGFFTVERR